MCLNITYLNNTNLKKDLKIKIDNTNNFSEKIKQAEKLEREIFKKELSKLGFVSKTLLRKAEKLLKRLESKEKNVNHVYNILKNNENSDLSNFCITVVDHLYFSIQLASDAFINKHHNEQWLNKMHLEIKELDLKEKLTVLSVYRDTENLLLALYSFFSKNKFWNINASLLASLLSRSVSTIKRAKKKLIEKGLLSSDQAKHKNHPSGKVIFNNKNINQIKERNLMIEPKNKFNSYQVLKKINPVLILQRLEKYWFKNWIAKVYEGDTYRQLKAMHALSINNKQFINYLFKENKINKWIYKVLKLEKII